MINVAHFQLNLRKIACRGKNCGNLRGTAKTANLRQNMKIAEKLRTARSRFSARTNYSLLWWHGFIHTAQLKWYMLFLVELSCLHVPF